MLHHMTESSSQVRLTFVTLKQWLCSCQDLESQCKKQDTGAIRAISAHSSSHTSGRGCTSLSLWSLSTAVSFSFRLDTSVISSSFWVSRAVRFSSSCRAISTLYSAELRSLYTMSLLHVRVQHGYISTLDLNLNMQFCCSLKVRPEAETLKLKMGDSANIVNCTRKHVS